MLRNVQNEGGVNGFLNNVKKKTTDLGDDVIPYFALRLWRVLFSDDRGLLMLMYLRYIIYEIISDVPEIYHIWDYLMYLRYIIYEIYLMYLRYILRYIWCQCNPNIWRMDERKMMLMYLKSSWDVLSMYEITLRCLSM